MSNIITRIIPNSVTCLNLLCGCLAITCAFSPFDTICGVYGYQAAFILILGGAVADFFDGFTARLLNVHSPIGGDLDSLSDLVTFGVAPAMLLFNLFEASPAPLWMRWVTMLIPVCGALRLARFNVDASQTTVFRGLPIPSCALFCIGLADIMVSPSGFNPYAAVGCVAFIALLMVAPLSMMSLKFKSYAPKGSNLMRYLLLLAAVVCLCLWHWTGLLIVICLYILLSLAGNVMGAFGRHEDKESAL